MKNIAKLSWIINNACNLKCVHCYPNSGIETRKEFGDDEFENLRKNLSNTHFSRVFLSGGEPIIDKNFRKYLDIAKDIADDVYLCSNGTLLTDAKLKELSEWGVKGIVLSLQAIDKNLSLTIYGSEQVPNNVFNAISLAKKYNFSIGVEITMMKQNISSIDGIVQELISRDVKFISFKRLMPVGRGTSDNVCITKEENFQMLEKIFNWQITNPDIRFNVHDPLYGTILYEHFGSIEKPAIHEWLKSFSCRAGTRWIGIDPLGNVSPCPLLLYKNTIIGNVMETPLDDILSKSKLVRLLQNAEKATSDCKYGAYCLGCRVSAISKAGDIFSKDPMCVYEGQCPICNIGKGENR